MTARSAGGCLGSALLAVLVATGGCFENADSSGRDAYVGFCPTAPPALVEPTTLVPRPRLVFQWGNIVTAEITVVEHAPDEWPELLGACGFEVPAVAGAYYLRVNDTSEAHLFAADAEGTWNGRQTLKQLTRADGVRSATLLDWPSTPLRGVLEGFYGAAWDQADRLALLPELAALKMNTYLYAPKNDYSINLGWMVPFDEEQIGRIQEVVAEARKHHIRVCWELHAGFPVTFSDESHFAAFRDKFHVIAEQGVDCLVLAFDDVGKGLTPDDIGQYADFTTGLIEFANRLAVDLHAAYPDALLGFVPVEYWTEHEDATTDLSRQGVELNEHWVLAWTGPQIVSPTITAADVDEIDALLGREVLLGDNYPVSDTVSRSGTIHLAPLVGRDPEAASGVGGFLLNGMPLAWASLPGIATGADFAWNAEGYESERSLEAVALRYAGAASCAFKAFCHANSSELLHGSAAPALDADLAEFWSAWGRGDVAAIGNAGSALLVNHLDRYAGLTAAFDSGNIHAGIAEEVRPWVDKLAGYGEAGLVALALLEAKARGEAIDPERLAELDEVVDLLAAMGPQVTGESMDGFLARAVEVLSE